MRKLDQDYECLGLLGKGSFANVYLAKTSSSSGRKVAIKIFKLWAKTSQETGTSSSSTGDNDDDNTDDYDDEDDDIQLRYESYQREIDTIAKLPDRDKSEHSRELSICYLQDWFEQEKNAQPRNPFTFGTNTTSRRNYSYGCLVMQYVPGGTLAMEIASKNPTTEIQQNQGENAHPEPYTERRIAWYALQLCEALAFMHEHGIAHYDVKSRNILIDRMLGDKLVITDFGNTVSLQNQQRATAFGPATTPSTMMEPSGFTEMYAPPELLKWHIDNAESDSDESNGTGDNINSNIPAGINPEIARAMRVLEQSQRDEERQRRRDQRQQQRLQSQPDGEKIDAFGLGAILFEMVCCQPMKDLTGEDETIGEFVRRAGVDALLNLPCVRLPWLTDDSNNDVIGYSPGLRNLINILLHPDPAQRWTPRTLEGLLRSDPKSPLLADFCSAAQPLIPGTQITVDNIQVGMFVQHGLDWSSSSHASSSGTGFGTNNSTTTFSTGFSFGSSNNTTTPSTGFTFGSDNNRNTTSPGPVGVVVGLCPDAGYCHVQWPTVATPSNSMFASEGQRQQAEWILCRIGANNKYELQIGPMSLPDFMPSSASAESTNQQGEEEAARITGMIPVPDVSAYTVGQIINNHTNNNWMVVAISKEKRCIFVAPTGSASIPSQPLPPSRPPAIIPPLRADSLTQNQQLVPDHWQLDAGLFVEIHDRAANTADQSSASIVRERQLVYDMFFSEGGMDISRYELVSIQRVQSEGLWTAYAATKEIVESEHWGISNERQFFHGISSSYAGASLADLIHEHDNPGGAPEIYRHCITETRLFPGDGGEIRFPLSVSVADNDHLTTERDPRATPQFQLIISKVVLGRVLNEDNDRAHHIQGQYHSAFKKDYSGTTRDKSVSIQNPLQAYPEYVVTYQRTPGSEGIARRRVSSPGAVADPSRFARPRFSFGRSSEIAANPTFSFQQPPPASARVGSSGGQPAQAKSLADSKPAAKSADIGKEEKTEAKKASPPSPSPTKKCVICWERPVNQVLIPCGHPCLCEICSTKQALAKMKRKCPECRQTIQKTITIYGRVVND